MGREYLHGIEPVHTEEEGRIICDLLAGEPESVHTLSQLPVWRAAQHNRCHPPCGSAAARALAQLACC